MVTWHWTCEAASGSAGGLACAPASGVAGALANRKGHAMRRREASTRAGFTLIEVLIVMIILAILAAIAMPMYLGQRDRAKGAAVKASIHSIQVAVESYAVDNGDQYPAGPLTTGTGASVAPGAWIVDGSSQYLGQWPANAWTGNPMMDVGAGTPTEGDFSYAQLSTDFVLAGFGGGGAVLIQVP